MTRFLSFAGALLLMLACALTAHATTVTLKGDTVLHSMSYFTGTDTVLVNVYKVSSGVLQWTSNPIPDVNFASPTGTFNFMTDIPSTYFTTSPGDYEVEIVIQLPSPAAPAVLMPRMRLVSGTITYYNSLFTW